MARDQPLLYGGTSLRYQKILDLIPVVITVPLIIIIIIIKSHRKPKHYYIVLPTQRMKPLQYFLISTFKYDLKLYITIAIFVEGMLRQNETKIDSSRSIKHLILVSKCAFFFRVCANQYEGTVI
jgi:hypothetical protein